MLPDLDIKGTILLIGTTDMYYCAINSTVGDCYFGKESVAGFARYDSSTNTFVSLTSSPSNVTQYAYGSYGDYIYKSGGRSTQTQRGADLHRYTISTDTWTILPNGSASSTNYQSVTANDTYAFKMLGNGSTYRYNLSTNTYQALSTTPLMELGYDARADYLCIRNIGDTMYCLSRKTLSSMQMTYDGTNPVFTKLADYPGYVGNESEYICEMCVYKDNLYVLNNRSELFCYNVSTNSWRAYGVICPVTSKGFNDRNPVLFCASIKDSCLYCLIPTSTTSCNMYKIT